MRVTLLTDFGTGDGYAAAMKGVMAAIAPSVIVDDVSHEIAAGDVHGAAWALGAYWNRYPAGTVHVVVVDPGVGSARRALALQCDGRFLVGPDNGVFTYVLASAGQWQAVSVESRRFIGDVVSATFHGRDIFAPVAAHLAAGVGIEDLGPVITDPRRFAVATPSSEPAGIRGEVVHIDRYGNVVTNIPAGAVIAGATVHAGDAAAPLVRTYADVRSGELLALVGSRDLLEISVRDGNAAERLAARRGDPVQLRPPPG